jgi:putative ABC transport system substrate-binding protein
MRRREFIAGIGAVICLSQPVRAQQPGPMRRIGVLMNGAANDPQYHSWFAAFIQGLHQLGWTEGENLRVDVRWNAGDAGLALAYGAQLIGLMPDVILTSSTTNLTVIRQATSTVPVVFLQVTDPVAQGFVASLSRPGGNLTTQLRYSLIADLAGRYRLPAIAAVSGFAKEGGLMDYGTTIDLAGQFRQAASYVDRILRGAKPGDLPVQGADRYSFVLNLKTAKALGLTVPETLLATADEVIQ